MSLAVDLRGALDLTAPVAEAVAGLSAHLQGDEVLRALVEGDPATILTGDLGQALAQLGSGVLSDPESLLAPLGRALGGLLAELDIGPLGPLGDMVDTIALAQRGIELLRDLLSDSIAPVDLGAELGVSLGDAVNLVLDQVQLPRQLAAVADLRPALEALDGLRAGDDPAALVDGLATVLLPLPAAALRAVRAHFDLLTARLGRLSSDAALAAALEGWAAALEAAALVEPDAIDAARPALSAVTQARAEVDRALGAAIEAAGLGVEGLRCGEWNAELRRLLGNLPSFPSRSIDSLTVAFAAQISELGTRIGAITSEQILTGIAAMRAQADEFLEESLGPIPAVLDQAEQRLTALLQSLPTRTFRASLQQAADDLVDRVYALDIDAVPRAVRAAFADLRAAIEGDVVARVQTSVAAAVDAVNAALASLEALLGTVHDRLDAAVDQVDSVLARVRDALVAFRTSLEQVQSLSAEIDLVGAGQAVRDNAASVADTVEELLRGGLLPEVLRPVLAQAADAVANLDLRALLTEPATRAVADLRIELPAEVTDALAEAAQLLREAVPHSVIEQLDSPVLEVARALEAFDPAALTAALSTALDSAARQVAGLDLRPYLRPIEEAFRLVLAQLDRLDPARLLAPLAALYDDALGVLGGIDVLGAGDRFLAGFEHAADPLREVVDTAARRITSESTGGGGPALPDPPPPADTPGRPRPLFRPGDALRALGPVLDRIRLTLEPLDDAVLVPAFRELHAITHQLSARAAPEELIAMADAMLTASLAPLSAEVAVPAGGRLALAWERAAARHRLDVALSPAVLFGVRGPQLEELRGRARGCLDDLRASDEALRRFAGSLRAAVPGALGTEPTDRGPIEAFLAQLDPEPVAAALDQLVDDALLRILEVGATLGETLGDLRTEVETRLARLGPQQLLERLARLVAVLTAELEALNPRNLAADVRPVFLALRHQIEAWSPGALAEDVAATLRTVGDALRALDPAVLLGDLSELDDLAGRVAALAPGRLLRPLAERLGEVGAELAELDPNAAVESLLAVGATTIENLGLALEQVQSALADLLRRLGADAPATISVALEVPA